MTVGSKIWVEIMMGNDAFLKNLERVRANLKNFGSVVSCVRTKCYIFLLICDTLFSKT